MAHSTRRKFFKIDNIKYNNDNHFNDFINSDLINDKKNQTLNKFYNKNNRLHKNNSLNSKIFQKKENRNINNVNLILENENINSKADINNKKNNTLTNLLIKNKKDFIYFNRNKQNYIKQNTKSSKANKIKTYYFKNRNDNYKERNRKMNTFQQTNIIKNIRDNDEDIHENYKNNSDSSNNNINIDIENENNENKEIKELLKSLKLKSIKTKIKRISNY